MSLTKISFSMITGEVANVLDYGADSTGVADSSAAIQAALTARQQVYIPAGTYLINTALLPRTTQSIFGDGVNQTRLKAGTVGMTVLSYPSSAYSNVVLSNFTIDGDSKAATGISMIASGQGAISNCEINNVSIGVCTLYQMYLSQATYCVVDRCAFSGGDYALFLNDCFSSEVKNCILYDGAQASLLIAKGAQITFSKNNLFNEAANPSPALCIIDGGNAHAFVDCEFEPQGASNVTYEVILKDTFVGGACTDNSFTRCRFIGLPNTKTNCVAVGTVSFAFKTRFTECGFIKPTSTSSIALIGQSETSFARNYDLVTYDTPTYLAITITNSSGNPYFQEDLTGNFINVYTNSVSFPSVQIPSSNANTLDDYEEGVWSPVLIGGTTNPTGVTFSNGTTGTFVKVGRLVTAQFYFGTINWSAAGTGLFYIGGFPYSGGDPYTPVMISGCTVQPTMFSAIFDNPNSKAYLLTSSGAALTWADAVNNTTMSVRASYYANA